MNWKNWPFVQQIYSRPRLFFALMLGIGLYLALPSLLLVGEELYFVSDSGGFFTCLDARTGAEQFRERLGGNHNASPLYAGGRIYLPSREGSVMVIEPGRQFHPVVTNTVAGKIMATPAVVGRSIFLRTDRSLYRIESANR
jgi:outer membrane protein assembly factor BamB